MALIICPECKKELSSMATSCPHCGYILKKKSSKQTVALFSIICGTFLIVVFALILFFQKKQQNTDINFSLGPTSGTSSSTNDTEKISSMDTPLVFGETITIHTSCPANLFDEGTIDMYTVEITPLDYATVGTETLIEFDIKLISFDNDNEQSISVDDIMRNINIVGKDGTSNNYAPWVYSDIDEATHDLLYGGVGSTFSLRAGGKGTYYVIFLETPEPAFIEVCASTYVSWGNHDYVRNYYTF